MSVTLFSRTSSVAILGLAVIGLSACQHGGDRYGHAGQQVAHAANPVSVYDFESGANCGVAPAPGCGVAVAPIAPVAPAPVAPAPLPPVYMDCSTVSNFNCGTTVTTPTVTHSTTQVMSIECPVGTTKQADGTCLQGSVHSTPITPPVVRPSLPVDCPHGTTPQSDGTCMQSHTPPPVFKPSVPAVSCPVGTIQQANGSCLQTGYTPTVKAPVTYLPTRK